LHYARTRFVIHFHTAASSSSSASSSTAEFTERALIALIERTAVFARTSPAEKERVITAMRAAGRVALMCGDGTNDVGAPAEGREDVERACVSIVSSLSYS
jgi:soluble P-type ATPase